MTSLCQLAEDWRGDVPAGGLMVERKHDGWRCLYFRGIDGRPRLWTRQGIPIEGCAHIAAQLQRMEAAADCAMVFDGELVVDETLAATKAWCESGWRIGGDAGIFHAFDCLPHRDWAQDGSDAPLYQRKARLAELFAVAQDDGDGWTWREGSRGAPDPIAVVLVDDDWVFDAADIITEANRVWSAGGEGLMLKDAEAPYRRTRNGAWQKVKRENAHKWARHPIAA